MRALVIDDSRSMRAIITRVLSGLGATDIVTTENGRTALEVLETGPVPDLALVDWHMPVMSGYEVVCEVRRNPRWRSMTLVMLTTENEHGQIVKALAAGATDYLIKPFTPEALVEKLSLLGLNPLTGAFS